MFEISTETIQKMSLGKKEESDEKVTKSDKERTGINQKSDATHQKYLFIYISVTQFFILISDLVLI